MRSIALWLVACVLMTLSYGPITSVPTVMAASSFNPTIFVNTEAFLVIDDDDTTADVVMRFGDTLLKTLIFNRTLDRFEFNDDLYVNNTIQASGTISGATIFGMKVMRSSGTLLVESGAYIDGNTLVVQAGNNRVGIGTASPGYNLEIESAGPAGVSLEADTDNATESDTAFIRMSQDGGGITGIFGLTAGTGVDPESGAYTNTLDNGILIGSHATAFNIPLQLGTDGIVRATIDGASGNVGIGTTAPKSKFDVVGTISGITVYATKSFSGAGLSDCDGSTHALLWDATTGRFSCDTTAGNQYSAGQGLTLNGTSFSLTPSHSGTVIWATNTLRSSGTLVWEGNGSGRTLNISKSLSVGTAHSGNLLTIGRVGSGRSLTTASNATLFSTDQMALGQLEGGAVFGRVGLKENQWGLSNIGRTWTAVESSRAWESIAMSSDGQRMTAVVFGGQIYVSTTYGQTWTAKDSSRNWNGVAMSSDGKMQTAIVDGGQIYVSSDYGATWTARESNRAWFHVAMSSDGKIQTATISNAGQLYVSTDYGHTWTARESNRNWYDVALSSDGKLQTAVVPSGRIYASTDYGATWTAKDTANRGWNACAMSSDGRIQVAVGSDGTYMSYDYGNTWTLALAASNIPFDVAMSSDGRFLTMVEDGNDRFISTDYGQTWTLPGSGDQNWRAVAMSSDGKIQLIGVSGGQLYLSYAYSYQYGSVAIGTGSVRGNTKLMVQGMFSGVTVYATKSFSGAGLSDCDNGTTSKLLWDATTGRFSCGTDQTGGAGGNWSNTGSLMAAFDTRYVNVAGDTMTGVLAVQNGNTHTPTATPLINVRGTVSGQTLYGNATVRSSGTLLVESGAYIDGTTVVVQSNLNRVGIGTADPVTKLHVRGTNDGQIMVSDSASSTASVILNHFMVGETTNDGTQLQQNGANAFLNNRENGNLSFSTNSLERLFIGASGNIGINNNSPDAKLDVVGTISGVTVYAMQSFSGAGLSDCDGSTHALLWDATTGRFSCDTTAGTTYSAGQGLTLNGTSFSLSQTISGTLLEFQTVSGSTVYGSKSLRSSGSLSVEESAWIGNENGGGSAGINITTSAANRSYIDLYNGTAKKVDLFWSDMANQFIINSVNIGDTLIPTMNVGIGYSEGSVPKAKLDVLGTVSGITVYATRSFSGAGLSDCDNGTTSKLLWDATTGRFSCGTDQTGAAGGNWSNTGSLMAAFDTRYVNVAGDTMTGALVIQNGNTHAATATRLLNVRGTMSGVNLFISGTGSTALLSTETVRPMVKIAGSGMLTIQSRTRDPGSAPTGTAGLHAQNVGGRPMLHQSSGSTFSAHVLQPSLFGNLIMILSSGGGTTVNGYGTTVTNDTTVSHPAADQTFGYMTNFATAATTNDEAGTSSANVAYFRGSAAGANGFFYAARVGVVDVTSITVFSGMADQTIATMVGADNPAGNHVGFQFSTGRGDTNWMFTTKDGTTQNVNSTGLAFTANKVYDLYFTCTKQCGTITWEIRNVTDGTSATGTTSTNLPTTTAAMRIVLGVEAETTTAKNIRMQQIYVEADR